MHHFGGFEHAGRGGVINREKTCIDFRMHANFESKYRLSNFSVPNWLISRPPSRHGNQVSMMQSFINSVCEPLGCEIKIDGDDILVGLPNG